jgi:hypothetical protein
MKRTANELPFDSSDNLGEPAVIEGPYQNEAGVTSPGLSPFACQWGKVAAVASYEYALLRGRQPKDLRIWQSLEDLIFGQCQHVVVCVAQRSRDPARREVRIEQQTQAL